MSSHELHFITTGPGSSGSQRNAARSHAARSTHAKARRLRTLQYQAQKAGDAHKHRRSTDDHGRSRSPNVDPIDRLSYHRRDPFMSSARTLNPTEQMLFDHYVIGVIPLMRCNAFDLEFGRRMIGAWIPLALAEEGLLDILMLVACRHLNECYRSRDDQSFARLAFQYKLLVLRSLRQTISAGDPNFSDVTVITAIMLAYDEIWVGDESSMKRHVEGAVKIVTLKGGPDTLGLDGFIKRLLFNLLTKVNQDIGLSVKSPWDPRIASMEISR